MIIIIIINNDNNNNNNNNNTFSLVSNITADIHTTIGIWASAGLRPNSFNVDCTKLWI